MNDLRYFHEFIENSLKNLDKHKRKICECDTLSEIGGPITLYEILFYILKKIFSLYDREVMKRFISSKHRI